jgi:hypothetical protein
MEILDKLTHSLKRTIQKSYIELRRKTKIPEDDKSEYIHEFMAIHKKLIRNKETELLFAPISSKRYLKNEEFGITVVIHNRNAEIINHIYSYSIHLDDKSWSKVIREFNEELENRREEFEVEITANIKKSLKNILNSITPKNEK